MKLNQRLKIIVERFNIEMFILKVLMNSALNKVILIFNQQPLANRTLFLIVIFLRISAALTIFKTSQRLVHQIKVTKTAKILK